MTRTALRSQWLSHLAVCVVLLSVTHVQAQEMDTTPQEIVFDRPITTAPEATSPEPAAPTVAPPPAAAPPTSPPSVAAPQWQKSSAFRLQPPLPPVTYGGQIALAYLWPLAVPIVHGLHGNLGRGFLALLGFSGSVLGGMILGAALSPGDDSGGHVPVPQGGAFLGLLIGAIGWVIFDANVLAIEDPPPPAGRLQPLVFGPYR